MKVPIDSSLLLFYPSLYLPIYVPKIIVLRLVDENKRLALFLDLVHEEEQKKDDSRNESKETSIESTLPSEMEAGNSVQVSKLKLQLWDFLLLSLLF